jgi:hypothetical protein
VKGIFNFLVWTLFDGGDRLVNNFGSEYELRCGSLHLKTVLSSVFWCSYEGLRVTGFGLNSDV